MYCICSLRAEMYCCSLCWKDERTLLIGWGDKIKVCVIREREQLDVRDLPDKYVEIGKMPALGSPHRGGKSGKERKCQRIVRELFSFTKFK